jgi:hypothetical protein
MRPPEIPQMDNGMIPIVRGDELCALIHALFVVFVRPVRGPPPCLMNWVGGSHYIGSLLSTAVDGEVPDFDSPIHTGTEQVFAVWVPVDGSASFLVVSGDLLLWAFRVAEVPTLDGAVVGAESKIDSVGGGPLHITNAPVDAGVLVTAATSGSVSSHVAEVPQANGGIVTGREEQVALVGVEGQLMDLAGVLVQADEFDTGAIQIVEDDLAVGDSSGNVGAELAMRPLDVLDAESLTLASMRVGIVEDGGAQVGLVDNLGIVDADRLEDFLACKHGMGAVTVDVEGSNVETGLVAGVVRGAGADAGHVLSGGWW